MFIVAMLRYYVVLSLWLSLTGSVSLCVYLSVPLWWWYLAGLMIDTARHFIPLSSLRRTLDAMQLVKLNTLHLHLTDAQVGSISGRDNQIVVWSLMCINLIIAFS